MTHTHRIYVDLLKIDGHRRLKLTPVGTREDLDRLGIVLVEGLSLRLYSDDLNDEGERDDFIFDGVAHFDESTETWVAAVDWDAIRHESDLIDD
jgi:hypothetical protein